MCDRSEDADFCMVDGNLPDRSLFFFYSKRASGTPVAWRTVVCPFDVVF